MAVTRQRNNFCMDKYTFSESLWNFRSKNVSNKFIHIGKVDKNHAWTSPSAYENHTFTQTAGQLTLLATEHLFMIKYTYPNRLWSYTFPKMNWVSLCLKSVFELWKKLASEVVKLCRVPTGKAVSNLLANHKAQRGSFPIVFAIWGKKLCPSGSGMNQAATGDINYAFLFSVYPFTGDINSALLFSVYPFTAVPLAFFLFLFFLFFSFFSFLFC